MATYNARTLLSEEKFTEMEIELEKVNWDVVGVSEVRRRGEGLETLRSGHMFYHVGNENESVGGVGFFVHKNHSKSVISIHSISPRVAYIILRLNARYNIKIIQIYAPTTDYIDEQVDVFYDEVAEAIKQSPEHYTILCGDFNAKIGVKSDPSEVAMGNFGSDGRNERGETLLGFLLENNLYQMNSFFYKKQHRRWTWKSPDGKTHNEIDYFITNKKDIFTDVTVINKFSTGSDHRMVRATIKINLEVERYKMVRSETKTPTWTHPQNEESFQKYITENLEANWLPDSDIDTLNNLIVNTTSEAQKKFCPRREKDEKISPETRTMMEERRALRQNTNVDPQEIRNINKNISNSIRKDIRKYKEEKIMQTIEDNKSMKVLRRKFENGKKEIFTLKDMQGNLTSNREQIIKVVEEFYEELYRNRNEMAAEPVELTIDRVINQGSEDIPDINKEEILYALTKMKHNKATGEDGVAIEAIKLGGETLLSKIQILLNLCLHQQAIPSRWNEAIMILMHKKGDNTNLENYRPISLLNHLYKLYTRIITSRMENKMELYQPREQAGFRSGYGTNDHLQVLKVLIEKTIEYNRPLVLLFVDFQKAFDTVEFDAIMKCLRESRVDYRYAKIILNIYRNATTTVKLHANSRQINVKRGVRQGDTMSPKLFTAILEHAFKDLKWDTKGVRIDGEQLNHLRFADDIVLITDNLEDAKNMLIDLKNVSQKVGLQINYSKTKMMTNLVPSEQIEVDESTIELVEKYIYLGHEVKINRDNQTCELARRVTLGWAAYGRLSNIFKSSIPIRLKRKAFNQCVLPVLTYGAETLTLTRSSIKKLQIAQRKMERSMLGLTLRDRVRNEDLRGRTKVDDIIEHITRAKWRWAGHIARLKDGRWTKRILEWRPRADKRSRGRPPTRWTDDIKRISSNWIAAAQDRKTWKRLEEAYVQQWTNVAG